MLKSHILLISDYWHWILKNKVFFKTIRGSDYFEYLLFHILYIRVILTGRPVLDTTDNPSNCKHSFFMFFKKAFSQKKKTPKSNFISYIVRVWIYLLVLNLIKTSILKKFKLNLFNYIIEYLNLQGRKNTAKNIFTIFLNNNFVCLIWNCIKRRFIFVYLFIFFVNLISVFNGMLQNNRKYNIKFHIKKYLKSNREYLDTMGKFLYIYFIFTIVSKI